MPNTFLRIYWDIMTFIIHFVNVVVVQSLSRVQLFVTPWAVAQQAPLPCTVSWSLLKVMSIESVMPMWLMLLEGAHWPIWGAEASLHPWNNTHLIRTYEHFNVLWNILLRTSTCKLYWPVIFATHCHSSLVLVSGWCWIYKTSLEEFYPHAFWKTLGRICIINSSLKMFGRIHHWRILVLDFGFWEAFDYWLSLLTIYHSVETVYIIMTQSW